MESKLKIYVAGPLGFSEAGRHFHYEKLIPSIQKAGYEVLDPWKLTSQQLIDSVLAIPDAEKRKKAWFSVNMLIGRNNERAIQDCDGMVAVLDGSDVDSGTAAEIGYASSLAKPILGYRGDFRQSADNEGGTVNLQVEYFIRKRSGTIISSIDHLEEELKKMMEKSSVRS